MGTPLVVSTHINAEPTEVFPQWLSADALRRWWWPEIPDTTYTVDGREGWLVESQLSFDIPGLTAKGELLIVAVVNAGATSGLYYASIPDTKPELVKPARDTLAALSVDI